MKNTVSYSSNDKNKRHWWLSIKRDSSNKAVTFTFLDYGIGIFES